MELIGGPAALGGIMLCVALCAWILGRWQGAIPPVAGPPERESDAGAPDEVGLLPQQARQQADTDDMVASLGSLHAEISAYRRAEQVLVRSSDDGLANVAALVAAAAPGAPRRADQPALSVPPSLTRV